MSETMTVETMRGLAVVSYSCDTCHSTIASGTTAQLSVQTEGRHRGRIMGARHVECPVLEDYDEAVRIDRDNGYRPGQW